MAITDPRADTGTIPVNAQLADPEPENATTTAAGDSSGRASTPPRVPAEEGSTGQGSKPEAPAQTLEIGDLSFEVEKSMRYHQRRRAHFERWHRWSMLAIIIFGSAAAARFKSTEALFGLSAALVGALDLVYSPAVRAAEHYQLHQRFAQLAVSIRTTLNPSVEQLRKWEADRIMIEVAEPPTFWALEADCFNETARVLGIKVERPNRVGWWRKPFKHMVRFEGVNFQQPA